MFSQKGHNNEVITKGFLLRYDGVCDYLRNDLIMSDKSKLGPLSLKVI